MKNTTKLKNAISVSALLVAGLFSSCSKDAGLVNEDSKNSALGNAVTLRSSNYNATQTFTTYDWQSSFSYPNSQTGWWDRKELEMYGPLTQQANYWAAGGYTRFEIQTGSSDSKCRFEKKYPYYIVSPSETNNTNFVHSVFLTGKFKVPTYVSGTTELNRGAWIMQLLYANFKPVVIVDAKPMEDRIRILISPDYTWNTVKNDFDGNPDTNKEFSIAYTNWDQPFTLGLDVRFSELTSEGSVKATVNGSTTIAQQFTHTALNPHSGKTFNMNYGLKGNGIAWSAGAYSGWRGAGFKASIYMYELSARNHSNTKVIETSHSPENAIN